MVAIACTQNADMSIQTPVAVNDLVISRRGGVEGNTGSWIHPKLRIVYSSWMSEESDINDN